MDVAATITLLKRHEGFRQFPYKDTVGVLTVGYGRNLQANGVSESEASQMLENDVRTTFYWLQNKFEWFAALTPLRQTALVDMVYNLGTGGFQGFLKVISALAAGNYDTAAAEMLNSKWASQVGSRAPELANMIRTGV